MSFDSFTQKVNALISRSGGGIQVKFFTEPDSGRFFARCSDGTTIIWNEMCKRMEVRWGNSEFTCNHKSIVAVGCLFLEHELYDGIKGGRPWYGEHDDEIDKKLRLERENIIKNNYKIIAITWSVVALIIVLILWLCLGEIAAIAFGSIFLFIFLSFLIAFLVRFP